MRVCVLRNGISITLDAAARRRLETIAADRNAPQRHAWRARIVWLSADGVGTNAIMAATCTAKTTVWRWQERFVAEGADGLLRDKTRPQDKAPVPDQHAARVVEMGLSGISCQGEHSDLDGGSPMPRCTPPAIPDALLDQLLAGADPRSAHESDGLIDSLKKALTERALNAEMDRHLGGEGGADNRRNGYGRKTVLTGNGQIGLDVPQGRQPCFDPQLRARCQRRFPDFDDKIISMCARGMSVREIVGHVRDLEGPGVSPALISAVTDAAPDEVATWQARPLEPTYPLVFSGAL
jgi:putative transposase